MADPRTPGWHPDPQRPGMLRWWNGLGWSDARKAVDAAQDRFAAVRPIAEEDARRGEGVLEAAKQAASAPGSAVRTAASDAARTARAAGGRAAGAQVAGAAAANSLATGAILLGILGIVLGAYGLLPLVGLVVSLGALARSRRLARQGERRTGLGQSLAGLVLSVVGLLRWIPVAVALLRDLHIDLS